MLVVDDEFALATAIRNGLAAQGFVVDLAHDGVEALRLSTTPATAYDVIVLDLRLPGLSGYRVCEQLRARGIRTPVLMLSAKDGEYDESSGGGAPRSRPGGGPPDPRIQEEVDALDLGADDYLTKPFSFPVLVARLRALIRRGGPSLPRPREAADQLRSGELSLDPARRRLRRGQFEVRLTPRETAILRYLMQRAGDVVPKADIVTSVWGPDFTGDPNIVEVYVGYLRRKIDPPSGPSSIETVRGAGYRLAG